MSPKITVLGGPSDKSDLPKAKPYGQMLAEARAEVPAGAGVVVAPGLVFLLDDPAPASDANVEADAVQDFSTDPEPRAEDTTTPEPEAAAQPVKRAARQSRQRKKAVGD